MLLLLIPGGIGYTVRHFLGGLAGGQSLLGPECSPPKVSDKIFAFADTDRRSALKKSAALKYCSCSNMRPDLADDAPPFLVAS